MDLRGLEAVVAVHEHESFSSAAQALYVSQPALTRRVALLERELDTRLFERTPRGVFLTEAGKALLGPAKRALRETQSIREAVESVRDGSRGSLTIVGMTNLSVGILGHLLAEFHSALPEIDIRVISSESSAASAAAVEAGEYDIAIVDTPVPATLTVLPIASEEFYAVFAGGGFSNTSDADIPTVTKQMLQGRTMVQLPAAQFPEQRGMQLWDMVGVEPGRRLEISHCGLLLPVARSGRAVAVLPRSVALAGRAEGLDIAAPPRPIHRTVGFATLRSSTSRPVAQFLNLTRLIRPISSDPLNRLSVGTEPERIHSEH